MTNEQFYELLEVNGWIKKKSGIWKFEYTMVTLDYNLYINADNNMISLHILCDDNINNVHYSCYDVNKIINELKSKCGIELKPIEKFSPVKYLYENVESHLHTLLYLYENVESHLHTLLDHFSRLAIDGKWSKDKYDKLINLLKSIDDFLGNNKNDGE